MEIEKENEQEKNNSGINMFLSKKKRREKKLPVAITLEEYKKLIENTKNPKHKFAFYMAFNVGLRISEILKLKKSDFDFEGGKILIRQAKGKKDRVVPIPKSFQKKYLDLIPLNLSRRALEKAFKNNLNKAGVLEKKPTAHFHSLRHGFATRFIENGGDINHLKVLMGHSNISTTDIYNQLNPKLAIESYNKIW